LKAKQKLLQILFAVAGIAMAAAAIWKLHGIFAEYSAGDDTYAEAADAAVTVQFTPIPLQETETTVEPVLPSAPITVDFSVLSAVRGEVVGWLYGADTALNYPVLQCSNNEYYLDRLPDGTYNKAGSLFLDCDTPQDLSALNSIIYGHHMKNGSMFGNLELFMDEEYFDSHRELWYLTPHGDYRIDVLLAATVKDDSETYRHYLDRASFEAYLAETAAESVQTVEFDPADIGPVLVLSTCSNAFENARFIVIGEIIPITEG